MLTDSNLDTDDLLVVEDDSQEVRETPTRAWRVLVVDDDEDIHETTRFALAGARILDRPIELLHARSAAEAAKLVANTDDIAVALVDVVMETPDAGLKLVHELRDGGYRAMRIVLRTGQPGYAPGLEVISTYEIDDYRTKSELTQRRLLTVLTAAIRAYDQICTITRSRAGLEMVVQSATMLFQRHNMELFSRGVLTQIASLLRVSPEGFVGVSNTSEDGTTDFRVVSAMGRFADLIGKPLDDLPDRDISRLLEEARQQDDPIFRDGHMALHFRCKSGRELSILIEAHCEFAAADLALLKLFSTNISVGFENLALVERLDRLAFYDPVLEVPNANAFEAALEARLASQRKGGRMALMSVDSFQSLLADYGPRVAHQLLKDVYGTLVSSSKTASTVARVGDGAFALLGDRDALPQDFLTTVFDMPYDVDGIEIATTATGAIIDLDEVEPDPPTIMRTASSALLHAKRTQRGKSILYDASARAEVERRIDLQVALKHAVDHGDGFAVHLQPKVNLATGEVIGAEALLRWTHDETAVSPAEFIPIAESGGLTQSLTDFVILAVGNWANERNGAAPLPVAVNLSMTDLNNPGFAARLLTQVAAAGLSSDVIEFEVTEGIAMQNTPWAIEQVRTLNDAGFRIALDDFGTGYSSLGHFDRLPIDTLKIDRSFVTPLDVRTARNSLAAIVLAMTQALDVDCVAEGIETAEQNQALMFLGCTIGQGFFFGRPVAIGEFDDRFLQRQCA